MGAEHEQDRRREDSVWNDRNEVFEQFAPDQLERNIRIGDTATAEDRHEKSRCSREDEPVPGIMTVRPCAEHEVVIGPPGPQQIELRHLDLSVAVEVEDPGPACSVHRSASGAPVPGVLLVHEDSDPGIQGRQAVQDRWRSIGGAVVDDHQLAARNPIEDVPLDVGDDLCDPVRLVVDRHHDGHRHAIGCPAHRLHASSGRPRTIRRATSIPIFTA